MVVLGGHDVAALLLDIEGTITSFSFVKDQLFGYVREHLEDYVTEQWDTAEMSHVVSEFLKLVESGSVEGLVPMAENNLKGSLIQNVTLLMDKDLKVTPLKTLQGHMWKHAYASGAVQGHLFPDVMPALEKVVSRGAKVFIYSSGSILAQKLLFAHSVNGDISHLLSGYFDTTTGPKVERKSYGLIADEIGVQPQKIMFLTDVLREAQPAKDAGLHVMLVSRPGNDVLDKDQAVDFGTIESLDELFSSEN